MFFKSQIRHSVILLCCMGMFSSCGDDNGSSVPQDEPENTSSSSSVIQQSSSSLNTESSDSKHNESSASKDESSVSSSSAILQSSSTLKTDSSESSSSSAENNDFDKSSSSSKVESSSSETSEETLGSSSSDNLSVSDAKIKPSGTYDCSKYSCITTKYLNQEFLESGKYGEILDERDNQVYKTIQIKDQVWLAQNLNLRYTQPTAEFDSSSICYDNSLENCEEYGRLYLWSATMDSAGVYSQTTVGCGYHVYCNSDDKVQGICPDGFHVPNRDEWATLFENTGGIKNKSYGEFEMVEPRALNNDSIWTLYYERIGYGYMVHEDKYGFAALPAGKANSSEVFKKMGELTYIWSSTDLDHPEDGSWEAYAVGMYFSETTFVNSFAGNGKYGWRSIRCIKD